MMTNQARVFQPRRVPLSTLPRTVTLSFTLVALLAWSAAAASSHAGQWELRVCAPHQSPPASSSDSGGFDNDIAAILADELGADLSFEWIITDRVGVQRSLHLGSCDVIVGIGESVTGVMSTVPYLRAPYVFVTRADRALDITSLDDPLLRELTIVTYPSGLPSVALDNRGIVDTVRELSPAATPEGLDRDTPVIDAVVSGEADVAIVYAAAAAARSVAEPGLLRIVPVTPELDFGATILPLYRTWTVGVRPHDEAFRDRINVALAVRWDEIVALIDSYGVPQLRVSRPPVPSERDGEVVRVGVIAPALTRQAHGMELIGEAARRGAVLAQNSIARTAERDEVGFEVLFASAPSFEATLRAADRLVALHGVQAIVGGFDDATAVALSERASAYGVPFFNTGSSLTALRNELCAPTTLHVEASAAMYLDAVVAGGAVPSDRDWFVVFEAGTSGDVLHERLATTLERLGDSGRVVGSARVEPRQFVFFDVLDQIRAADAGAVLVVLGTESTDQFLVQYEMMGLEASLGIVPTQFAQTRDVALRYRQSAPRSGAGARPALWDTTLESYGAADLNERYTSRNADPMESAAWSTYAAVMSVYAAARAGAAFDAEALVAFLTDPATEIDLGKGPGTSFRAWDNQLRQPLYLVQVDPDASWGSAVSTRVALASVVGQVPELADGVDPRAVLDLLGDDETTSACTF